MINLNPKELNFLRYMRVGRLATLSAKSEPHLVPLCFAFANGAIYIGTGPAGKKVRNILQNNRVAFTIDEYSEDWDNLRGIMITGEAFILEKGQEYERAKKIMFNKYQQYEKLGWKDGHDRVLKITPQKVKSWGLEEKAK